MFWPAERKVKSIGVQPVDIFEDGSVTLSLSRQDSLEVKKVHKGISSYGLSKIQKFNGMFIGKMEMSLIKGYYLYDMRGEKYPRVILIR